MKPVCSILLRGWKLNTELKNYKSFYRKVDGKIYIVGYRRLCCNVACQVSTIKDLSKSSMRKIYITYTECFKNECKWHCFYKN